MVLVPGTHVAIDSLLRERGYEPRFHGAYRITDHEALEAAMEASGKIRVDIEAVLSTGPSIPVLRRHGKTDKWHTVPICVDSGNYVSAKVRLSVQVSTPGASTSHIHMHVVCVTRAFRGTWWGMEARC